MLRQDKRTIQEQIDAEHSAQVDSEKGSRYGENGTSLYLLMLRQDKRAIQKQTEAEHSFFKWVILTEGSLTVPARQLESM